LFNIRQPWQPWQPMPKKRPYIAKTLGNLANLGNLHKYIIINNIYLKVAKVATFLVCSCIFENLYIAKFQGFWQPCQGFWQPIKRGAK